MLFNSIDYLLFLPTVFLLYWFIFKNSYKAQNYLILIASYIFYGLWDWRFLTLILFSTIVDFFVGQYIYHTRETNIRKMERRLKEFFSEGLISLIKLFIVKNIFKLLN